MRTEKGLQHLIAGIIIGNKDKSGNETAIEIIKVIKEENNLNMPHDSDSLLERAILTLDDYLNAGCKETRKQAAENAKFIYKEYYGFDYVNRNDR